MAHVVTIERAEAAPGVDYREMRGLGNGDDAHLLVLSPNEMLAAVERLRRHRDEEVGGDDRTRLWTGA